MFVASERTGQARRVGGNEGTDELYQFEVETYLTIKISPFQGYKSNHERVTILRISSIMSNAYILALFMVPPSLLNKLLLQTLNRSQIDPLLCVCLREKFITGRVLA